MRDIRLANAEICRNKSESFHYVSHKSKTTAMNDNKVTIFLQYEHGDSGFFGSEDIVVDAKSTVQDLRSMLITQQGPVEFKQVAHLLFWDRCLSDDSIVGELFSEYQDKLSRKRSGYRSTLPKHAYPIKLLSDTRSSEYVTLAVSHEARLTNFMFPITYTPAQCSDYIRDHLEIGAGAKISLSSTFLHQQYDSLKDNGFEAASTYHIVSLPSDHPLFGSEVFRPVTSARHQTNIKLVLEVATPAMVRVALSTYIRTARDIAEQIVRGTIGHYWQTDRVVKSLLSGGTSISPHLTISDLREQFCCDVHARDPIWLRPLHRPVEKTTKAANPAPSVDTLQKRINQLESLFPSFDVIIVTWAGNRSLSVKACHTVGVVKRRVAEVTGMPVGAFGLAMRDNETTFTFMRGDDVVLETFGATNGCVIHCLADPSNFK